MRLPLADDLFLAMEQRQGKLMGNAAFLGAVYLDPRFNSLLSEGDCSIAKAHLSSTMKRVRIASGRGHEKEEEVSLDIDESEDDEMEKLLKSSDRFKMVHQGSTADIDFQL